MMSCSGHESPEFEFWRVTNCSSVKPNDADLISADELFHDGIILPLHLLHLKPDPDPPSSFSDPPVSPIPEPEAVHEPELTRETASKRWSSFFRKSEHKPPANNRQREKKTGSGTGTGSTAAAELNINIWPFSRSRSAGNKLTRPRALKTRKISSAPCSRSNSSGESKSRKCPSSPVRGGVHLGRSSPVWQVRRRDPTGKTKPGRVGERMMGKREIGKVRRDKTVSEDNNKPKVSNLNVPVYTGYRSRFSCRNDERGSGSSNVTNGSNSSLFGFRNLFIKKVH